MGEIRRSIPEKLHAATAQSGHVLGAGVNEGADEAVVAESDHFDLGDATRAWLAEDDGATSI